MVSRYTISEPRNGETRLRVDGFLSLHVRIIFIRHAATGLNASATNMRRISYARQLLIERRACDLFSMFFFPSIYRDAATSRRFATIARDRVARENECQEAAFPRSEIRKSL